MDVQHDKVYRLGSQKYKAKKQTPNLLVWWMPRIRPAGESERIKGFVFKYMGGENKKKSRWISIGKYPEWSIRKARREYDQLYDQVHSYGRDPVE